ncbi:tetratricopeptide repeat protein [Dactylosporangium sp. NBC_01737]|uniref:tetratricopeptide repeat protein n=1 Tax=Dactylosporangium sp. NBC_01737 TaxID=2975959 RepID=UPI002E152B20|nr:tetratricopeptide repeat protein [Dactylosporangium sp. NBC_01737]
MDARAARGVQVGDHNTQTNYYAGRRAVSWPHLVGVVPPVAVGRLDRPVDAALEAAVTAGGAAAVVCQVLAGLGGVGKTQLAASLAHRWWRKRQVDLLVWVTATSRAAVLTRYAQAAVDVTGVEDPDPGDAAQRLLAWLAATGRRWLLVLDDLTDPADLQGLWPPVTPTGATIVTTRRRDTALLAGRALIDVGVFTPGQAVGYLHSRLGDQPHRLDEAAELAADLGGLPLALAQAAAYIADQDLTCAGYRRRLTRRRLHSLRPQVLPDDQPTAVADTWALSIDLADGATGGVAGLLLRLAALLDPNGIPAGLFATAAVTGYCTTRTGHPIDGDDTRDAVRALHRLSLVTAPPADSTDGLVRVHALLQRVVREHTPAEDEHDLAVAAADAINEVWPAHEPDAGTAQPLRANTIILHQHTGRHLWTTTDAGHLILFRTGNSLGNTGLVAVARDYFHQLHTTATAHLGPDHSDTLATRHNLARWRGEAGDPAGAAAAFEQLLDDYLRVLGPDHSDTLATRQNLAYWRGRAGDPAGAAAASEQLLDDRLRVLGPDHPDTLATRHNLARWRGRAGDPAGAAAAYEQLLDDRLRVLGPDHPDTLATRHNLAYWRGRPDPAGAAAAFEQLLDDYLRVLGPDHSDTLATRSNLARWRGEAGDPAGAAAAFEQLLDDYLRVLGPDHSNTLATRGNLARWRGEAGDPAGAAAAFEQLLDDYLRVLGPDHPDTLATRHNLARWRGRADPAGAAAAFEQLLDDYLRVLSPDHPDILTTRGNLAYWRGRAGDPAGAAAASEQLLDDRLRVLGPDHPDILTTRHNLAYWRGQAGAVGEESAK